MQTLVQQGMAKDRAQPRALQYATVGGVESLFFHITFCEQVAYEAEEEEAVIVDLFAQDL